MAAKQKQEVTIDSFVPDSISEENTPDFTDPSFWKSMDDKTNLPKENLNDEKQRQATLEQVYPHFTRKQIPLEKLIPANDKWNFFPAQNNNAIIDLMKNIVAYGQLAPAIVWEQSDGNYMILGGHNRFIAVNKLNSIFSNSDDEEEKDRFKTLDCNVYSHDELDEIEARKIIIFDNIIRRENTTAIKAKAVINMAQLEFETRAKRNPNIKRERALSNVAKVVGESEGTVKNLYKLRRLIQEFWPLIDSNDPNNKLTTQYARVIATLEPELQKHIFDQELYKIKLSTRKLNLLKEVKNIQEIDDIYSSPETYVLSAKAEIKDESAKDYVGLLVPCTSDEMQTMKDIIKYKVFDDPAISDKTKELLQQIFDAN